MGTVGGYKAVIEAANYFGRSLGGHAGPAGDVPPAKVLVIGAGTLSSLRILYSPEIEVPLACQPLEPLELSVRMSNASTQGRVTKRFYRVQS